MAGPGIPASLQRRVQPVRDGGLTTLDNLALACVSCSLRKGARSQVPDPLTGEPSPLFHPRRDPWPSHFLVGDDGSIESTTAIGRATIAALAFNRATAVAIRAELMELRRYP